VLHLFEIAPGMPAEDRQRHFGGALSCMVEVASAIEQPGFRLRLPAEEYHRLRILAIRATHRLCRLVAPGSGLLRATHPSLRALRLAG
jgi:hypothetical protein